MAYQKIDTTGNELLDRTLAKIKNMFVELYAAAGSGGALSVTSVTASGAVTGGSVTTTGATSTGSLQLDTGTKTAAATAGAATLAKDAGVITSEALTTAAGAAYTLTLTNSAIAAADQVFASVQNGTNSQGTLMVETVTPGAGSVVIVVRNIHASEALNGTIKIAFMTLKN